MTPSQGSAWSILQGWRVPPGYEPAEGGFDADALQSWVVRARRGLSERDRSAIGDHLIGEVLSGSPTGADGVWPAEPVRDLLEEIESEHLEDGLASGGVIARGMTTHEP